MTNMNDTIPPHPTVIEGKVAYICKRYPRFSETFIVNEILAHEAAGQKLEIFSLRSCDDSHFQENISRVKSPVTRILDRAKPSDHFWTVLLRANAHYPEGIARFLTEKNIAQSDAYQALQIAILCHDRGVTLLHAHFATVATTVARLVGIITGLPYTLTAHAKDIYCDYAENRDIAIKLRDAAQIITVSDFNTMHLADTYGLGPEKLSRLYNGLDLERFEWSMPEPAAVTILAVGRLVEKKGFHFLVEAIGILAARGIKAECRIIGSGDQYRFLKNRIDDAGLEDRITLSGPMPQPAVIAEMRQAALMACPCIIGEDGNRDGLPTVLTEAMAIGLPCISTDVVGIPEIVRDGLTGLCIAEENPVKLADAIQTLLADPAERLRLSQNARRLIEAEFEITINAEAQRRIFAKASLQQRP